MNLILNFKKKRCQTCLPQFHVPVISQKKTYNFQKRHRHTSPFHRHLCKSVRRKACRKRFLAVCLLTEMVADETLWGFFFDFFSRNIIFLALIPVISNFSCKNYGKIIRVNRSEMCIPLKPISKEDTLCC